MRKSKNLRFARSTPPRGPFPEKVGILAHPSYTMGQGFTKEYGTMAGGSAGEDILSPLNTLFQFGVVGDHSDGQLI